MYVFMCLGLTHPHLDSTNSANYAFFLVHQSLGEIYVNFQFSNVELMILQFNITLP